MVQTEIAVVAGSARERLPGRLLDLSAGGAFVTTPARAEVDDGAFVTFVYWGNHVCEATGHVIRTLPFGQETGLAIEFGFANEAFTAFLRTYERTAEALRPELLQALSEITIRLP